MNDWLQLIGMAGIIGSLIFVGLELRQGRRVSLNEMASITDEWKILLHSWVPVDWE